MFIELQELVPRVDGGLQFNESIFKMPVAAHFRVLWLETARWVNFEENFNEVEQRFTEAHVPPMKFSCINSFRDKLQQSKKLIVNLFCIILYCIFINYREKNIIFKKQCKNNFSVVL
ncbi:hypothetical protein Smp_191220 [Schistosoma mansoni]|uniref:hypothetical protein n=1 Tax=Schistosoma mansoni TaxID=6183 RepID=UPI00022DC8BB|nr:hypothetical protein Smp_191220 [Schistosoma mansoni]|eukprot:XP_018650388.1 hypothetical protein Smp_191220 [Schistosoma mansoni]